MADITPTFPLLPANVQITLPVLPSDAGSTVVGGFMASPNGLQQGSLALNGTSETILVGSAINPSTGAGVFIGNAGDGTYDFRAGDPSGANIWWDASAGTLTVTGTITATAGTLGGFAIGADYVRDIANSFGMASTVTAGDDVRFWAGDTFANRATAPFNVTESGVVTGNNIHLTGGAVATSVLNTSVMRATANIAFTSASNTQINWSSGTIVNAAGTAYTISSGNTGTMAALTYIYLDTAVSVTVLQTTTTYSTAVGDGKILVAVAQNASSGGAYCLPYLGGQPLINGASQINASSILAAQISVTSLSAISANIGSITSGTITLDTAGYVRGGQTDYNTGTGFFLGYSGAAYKFSIGNPSGRYITWDGTTLSVSGVAGFGGDGSDGALSISSGTTTVNLGGAANYIKNYSSISITGTAKIAFTNPHANGTVVTFKSQGNVTITTSGSPAIDLRQMGGTGGTAGAAQGFQSAGNPGNNGSGQPSYPALGIGGPNASTVAAATPAAQLFARGNHASSPSGKSVPAFAGAGGGAGGQGSGSTCLGGTGGTGGGGLYIECGGALNITSTIDVSGQNGTNATGPGSGGGGTSGGASGGAGVVDGILGTAPTSTGANASGGGGGGGGSIVILYTTLTADSGTYTVAGGSAGTSTTNAGTSGAGGAGISAIVKNTFFV